VKKIKFSTLLLLLILAISSCKKECKICPTCSNNEYIEYSIDGKNYKIDSGVTALFNSANFIRLTTNSNVATMGPHLLGYNGISVATEVNYDNFDFKFKADEGYYISILSQNTSVTFTKIKGNMLEGTFEGKVKLENGGESPLKTITGKFYTTHILNIGG
jgi:hypothetical protein